MVESRTLTKIAFDDLTLVVSNLQRDLEEGEAIFVSNAASTETWLLRQLYYGDSLVSLVASDENGQAHVFTYSPSSIAVKFSTAKFVGERVPIGFGDG